jgi:hypothetical protein
MARIPKGTLVTLGPQRRPFQCTLCGEKLFQQTHIEVGHFHAAAVGLSCMGCSYLHIFTDGGKVDMWRPDLGYPS